LAKLSLIIPCFNEEKNLPLLLKRCSQIDYQEGIEIIVVDNGSTDNSQNILKELLPDYSFVSMIHVKQNIGYGNGILEGLKSASGEFLSWTHADMQTDPFDVIQGMRIFKNISTPDQIFVKGKRYGRTFADVSFTVGMSFFETLLLRTLLWDINAQPNIFHRSFYEEWLEPPIDFSLDLYVYFMAKKNGLRIKRYPVFFGKRAHGVSSWNVSFADKIRFIKRTLDYSFTLERKMRRNA
jgi:glycosyltransferase involved in cell wall biosynthesis